MFQLNKKVILPRAIAGTAKSRPGYSSVGKGETLLNPNNNHLQESIQNLRSRNETIPALRKLSKDDGNFSSAVFNMVQVANSGFKIKAYTTGTNEYSQDGVDVATSVIAAIDTLYDYTKKYRDKQSKKKAEKDNKRAEIESIEKQVMEKILVKNVVM